MMKALFAKAVPPKHPSEVLAVIAPHAGYVFSGEVAASAYNQIDPSRKYETIFVIGPSHHMAFDGASIYVHGNYVTPLGTVRLNKDVASVLLRTGGPFRDIDGAHTREHSVEVQLPFLQYRLKQTFQIVPIVLGTEDPAVLQKVAEALAPYWKPGNLFVVSTDFSHYPSASDAVDVDRKTADAVLTRSPERLFKAIRGNEQQGISNLATCMCGLSGVLTLLFMIEDRPGVTIEAIQYKNSGDAVFGDKNRVVGYFAMAVYGNPHAESSGFHLQEDEKKQLLGIARSTIDEHLGAGARPPIDPARLPSSLKTPCGAFVTLRKDGELRGCIGRFDATSPLYAVVQDMAIASATQDYRFSPVTAKELPGLDIEISVLTPLRRISSIDEFDLGKQGIYITKGNRSGTFLPQVAQETGWTKEEFLGHCARDKAGLGWDGWKDADLFVYDAIVFSERESGVGNRK
jgi:hypothetical protein